MGTSFIDPHASVTVNDRDDFSACWICGDPVDHLGVPHSKATGDGLTRYDIVEFMGDLSWRTPEPEQLVTPVESACMSIGALREAIVNATELEGVFGQNVHESKDVLLRVGDKSYPLSEVSVGFHAPTGRFVMYLTAEEAKDDPSEPCRCPEHEPMSSDAGPRPVEAWSRCKRCKRLLWMGNGPEPDVL